MCINFVLLQSFSARTSQYMKDKRVLIISSEVVPYLPQTEQAVNSFQIPKAINEHGGQTRIFMPRYGLINERRHQLHEVIRLSGMNLVINDMDMPLIIKVASIPKERIQVYFIDNEEYFKRKATFTDKQGNLFPDNDQRAIFFAKGVMETVKKLNWSPDIIHVHGWMASLLPLYLKKFYADEPLFADSKIVLSVYGKTFEGSLDKDMIKKIAFDGIPDEAIASLADPTYNNLLKIAVDYSDAIILASEDIPEELENHISNQEKPVLPYVPVQEFEEAYANFYNTEVLK